ncbi:MAG: hypothetical protein JXQ29_11750 [Planctomycetes bacterium]|nr:hypothetical protein [Planctomycetota bacterium]
MAESSPAIPLKAALADLLSWFEDMQVEGVVIGGVAASLLGRPRATLDVDAVVWLHEERWTIFLEAAGRHGFSPRIPDALAFAKRSRVLLLTHSSTGVPADVAFGALPFEQQAIAHRTDHDLEGLKVPLPRPEDLVIMKAIAHRPRDDADIEGLLQARPDIDRRYVTETVREFARILDAPELLADLERLLARVRE